MIWRIRERNRIWSRADSAVSGVGVELEVGGAGDADAGSRVEYRMWILAGWGNVVVVVELFRWERMDIRGLVMFARDIRGSESGANIVVVSLRKRELYSFFTPRNEA